MTGFMNPNARCAGLLLANRQLIKSPEHSQAWVQPPLFNKEIFSFRTRLNTAVTITISFGISMCKVTSLASAGINLV